MKNIVIHNSIPIATLSAATCTDANGLGAHSYLVRTYGADYSARGYGLAFPWDSRCQGVDLSTLPQVA